MTRVKWSVKNSSPTVLGTPRSGTPPWSALNTVYGPSGYNILPANFTLDAATAVNDAGYITGWGTDGDGNTQQSFLLAPFLPGNANLDGKVDINDLTIVLARYGQSGINDGARGNFNNAARWTSTT